MTGRYAAKPSLSLKALAMGLVTLFFAALVVYQQALFSPARAAWDSGETVDLVASLNGTNQAFYSGAGVGLIPDNTFTVEAWVALNDFGARTDLYYSIFSQDQFGGGPDSGRFFLGITKAGDGTTGQFHIGSNCDGTAIADTVGTAFALGGNWHHVAVAADGANGFKIYLDGAEHATIAGTVCAPTSVGGAAIGSTIAGGGEDGLHFVDGEIDQVKVWDKPLTVSQIVESSKAWGSKYGTAEITGSASDLIAHFDFNEDSGTALYNRVSDVAPDLTSAGTPTITDKAPRLLINPTRSVVINDFAATTTIATAVTGTISAASATADYYLRLEAEAGSLTVSNLNGADAQDTSTNGSVGTEDYQGTKNITLRGTEAELQAALDATTFTATASGSPKLFATLTPVLDATNLGSYKQLAATGRLYTLPAGTGNFDTHAGNASNYVQLGNVGYLGTSTSAGENAALAAAYPLADVSNYYLGGSDSTSNNVWKWEYGPEAGIQFYSGDANDGGGAADDTSGPGYEAFYEVDGTNSEPNDNSNSNTDCLVNNFVDDGRWDDVGCSSNTHRALFELGGQQGEQGSEIATITVSVATVPGQVTGVSATQRLIDSDSAADSLTLTWGSVTHSPAVDEYDIEYSTASDFSGSATVTSATNSKAITDLTDGVTYYFRVRAVNSVGDGTWSATLTSRAISNLDYAMDFDGSYSATSTDAAVPTGDNAEFTVEAWVKADTIIGHEPIFSQGQANENSTVNRFWLGLYQTGATYNVHIGRDGDPGITILIPDPRGRWIHVAASVASNNEIKLYIDGQWYATVNNAYTDNSGTEAGFGIGNDENGNYPFDGQIDQVKVWDGVLTEAEIALSMHDWGKPSAGVDNTLLAHWDFNDWTNTTTVEDMAGNYDLTLTNASASDFEPLVSADSSVGGKKIYKFDRSYLTETGGWTVPNGVTSVRSLVVAGGGGGGADEGGGGGAGGFKDTSSQSVSGIEPVIVGQGGIAGESSSATTQKRLSRNGQDTSFGTGGNKISTTGGGRGGDSTNTGVVFRGGDGGSGGGGSGEKLTNVAGDGTAGQGNDGYASSSIRYGGGGGGAGAAATGRAGGAGAVSDITGTARYYAAGGSGGYGNTSSTAQASTNSIGGAGGGIGKDASAGAANTGSGGGGGQYLGNVNYGAPGGSGVVIVSFDSIEAPTISTQPANQAVLVNQSATFSVTATAANTISYQWQTSSDNTNWSNVAGATSPSYAVTLGSANEDDYFRVIITNTAGSASESVTSNAAQLTKTGTTVGTGVCVQGVSSATGVKVFQDGTDCVIAFTDSSAPNSWAIPAAAESAGVLVIAGGGGGGGGPYRAGDDNHMNGGGGGAGGFVESQLSMSPGSAASLQVGSAGAGLTRTGINTTNAPSKGGNSTFLDLTALGGGAGGYMPSTGTVIAATSGGSGGGGGAQANASYPISGAAGISGQGNQGGNGFHWNGSYQGSGGGGGAGGAGVSSSASTRKSGNGGAGKATTLLDSAALTGLNLFTGETARVVSSGNVFLAGGGGGGQRSLSPSGSAGAGGIGGGGTGGLSGPGVSALSNTGSGGGGGTSTGGDGASGLIVVRYTAAHTVTAISPTTGVSSTAVNATISGTKLAFGATAKLTKAGESDVNLTNVVVTSSSQISATIPSGIAAGTWNLVVTNADGSSQTLANAYTATGNFNVEFTEIDFDQANINSSLSCGTGKAQGDYQLYENVSTRNGVTIDGYVKTKTMTSGVTISNYEVGANAGGEDSYFQVDINVPRSPGSGYVEFEFKFFVDGTFAKGASCADPPTGTQVTLENVNVTGIDIDAEQYNIFTSMDSYTLANNTRLSKTITKEAAPADFPATGKFYATGDVGSNDPRDQVISTYGEIQTFVVTVGAESRGTAYFGLAFKALDWGSSSPQTVGEEYTLTYDANSGTGTVPASETGGVGANITVSSNSGGLTRSGFSFSGWNTKADGTGTSYAIGSNYQMPQGGATLYAEWEQAQLTLSYNANGGAGAPSGATYLEGATVTVSGTAPTRAGFNFVGWNTAADSSGTTRLAGATFAMPGTNLTLYAQWSAITYTISYNKGDGTGANNPASHVGAQGTSFTVNQNRYVSAVDPDTGAQTYTASYSRTGYTFAGWNTAQNGSGTDYAPGSTFTVGTSDVTLYAQWTPVIYNLTYHGNGGAGVPAVATATVGATVNISATVPTRPGYTFAGWETAADGSAVTTYGTAGGQTSSLTMPANNLTLYAIWTEITYDVTYNDNGGAGGPADDTANSAGDTITVGAAPNTAPVGKRFVGWTDLTNTFSPGQTFTMPSADVALQAEWVLSEIEVVYNAAGGTGAPAAADVDTQVPYNVSATEPTRTGYSFTGWIVSGGNGTVYRSGTPTSSMDLLTVPGANAGTVTLVAQWSVINYNITYQTQGGTPSSVTGATKNYGQVATVSATNVTKDGYTFLGWRATIGGSSYMFNASDTFLMPAADVTLTAIWDAEPYTLSYSANGGTGAPSSEVRIFGSANIVSITTPTRSGYVFAGWNTAADGSGDDYAPAQVLTMPAENVTLYAKWTVRSFTISFNANGGTGAPDSITGNFGNTETLPGTTPTRDGYVFAGWNTNCDGSGTDYAPGDSLTLGAANVTLCAVWSGVDNQLVYNPNGGTGGPGTSSVKTGVTVTVSGTQPTRPGFSFSSWNTSADGTGTGYAAADTFAMPAEDEELFAIWIGNPYTVYFNANGGSGASLPADIASTAGSSVTLPGTTPTRTGYTFAGWYANPAGTGTSYSGAITMPTEDLVLYAKWTAINYDLTYDINGADAGSAPADQSGTLDQSMTVAAATGVSLTGHWFAGWNTAADGSGSSIAVGQAFRMPLGGEVLYAIWVPDAYQISYNANGGTGGPDLSASDGYDTATFNQPYTIKDENNLARTGYTFSHWSRSADGSEGSYENNGDDANVFTTYTPTANTTFYAIWTPASYALTYNANTGTGTVPSGETLVYQDADDGSTIIADPTLLSKQYAKFVGWNTAADGSGTAYSVGSEFFAPAENTTLFAQWADIYFVVDFNPLGGSGAPDPLFAKNSENVTIPADAPTKSGYTFNNWVLPSSNTAITAGDTVTVAGANVLLFATYTQNQAPGGGGGGGGGAPAPQLPVVVPPAPQPEVTPPTPSPTPSPSVTPTPRPTQSPRPTASPRPTVTPQPTQSARPTQSETPAPSATSSARPTPTETQVAAPPAIADRVVGDGLRDWFGSPAEPEATQSGNQAAGEGTPEVNFDTGGEVRFTDSGALDLSTVKNVTTDELANEKISGFAPNSGLYIEVLGSRTGARFVATTANIVDSLTLIEAIRNSVPAQAADFFALDTVRVGSKPAPTDQWTEREREVAYDYFQASGLELPVKLSDVDVPEASQWIEVSASASSYVPRSKVFLTLTSTPLVIAEGFVDEFGNIELTGSLPLSYLEPGEHRVRLVGIRALGGVSVDDNGEIQISEETMGEIERFDLGTQATVRMGGKTPEGDYLNAIRVVPLEPVAPWWTLWFILLGLLLAGFARRRNWLSSWPKMILGLTVSLGSALPAVIIGWLSTVTLVTWVGLALGLISSVAIFMLQPREQQSEAKASQR